MEKAHLVLDFVEAEKNQEMINTQAEIDNQVKLVLSNHEQLQQQLNYWISLTEKVNTQTKVSMDSFKELGDLEHFCKTIESRIINLVSLVNKRE
jgi:uncharacterized protein YllA (UPF0747 family)